MVLVTVVIPVYKVEKYIRKCVDSIVNQTHTNLQIILINDGSPDNCGEICDSYSEMDNRIQVIHKENGGLSDSRNVGIDSAKGKYILFVDSDDYLEENAVSKLVEIAEDNKLDIVSANANKIKNNKTEKLVTHTLEQGKVMTGEEYMAKSIAQKALNAAVCVRLYRTDLIKNNRIYFPKGLLHEDEQWTPRVLIKTNRIMFYDYCFYNYVIRENSITQSINKDKNILSILTICRELEEIYRESLISEENKKLFLDYLSRVYMATSVLGEYNKHFYLQHVDKKFVKRNSYLPITKIKSVIFLSSIRLYRFIKQKGN